MAHHSCRGFAPPAAHWPSPRGKYAWGSNDTRTEAQDDEKQQAADEAAKANLAGTTEEAKDSKEEEEGR